MIWWQQHWKGAPWVLASQVIGTNGCRAGVQLLAWGTHLFAGCCSICCSFPSCIDRACTLRLQSLLWCNLCELGSNRCRLLMMWYQ
jgi:hypothetical protein